MNPVRAGYSGMYTVKGEDDRRDGIWSGREGHDQAANGCVEVVRRLTARLLNESRSYPGGEFASLHRYLIRFDAYTVGASFVNTERASWVLEMLHMLKPPKGQRQHILAREHPIVDASAMDGFDRPSAFVPKQGRR